MLYHSCTAAPISLLSISEPSQLPQWWWQLSRKMPCCGWVSSMLSTSEVRFLPKRFCVSAALLPASGPPITLPVCQLSYCDCMGKVGVLMCSLVHCAKMHFQAPPSSPLCASTHAAFRPAGELCWNL